MYYFLFKVLVGMLRSYVTGDFCNMRLSTHALHGIIHVCRKSLHTGHVVSSCSEFPCLVPFSTYNSTLPLTAVNRAVANICSVSLLVSLCPSVSRGFQGIPSLHF